MNKAEKYIGELCYGSAKNKHNAESYFNRYERMHRNKEFDKAKADRKQNKMEILEQEGELRFEK